MIIRKSPQEIEQMAKAGALVAETIALVGEHLEPGVSMLDLDRLAEDHIRAKGGVPTSKGYKGYPAALCISPNTMVVHGIPTAYTAREGDIISIDLDRRTVDLDVDESTLAARRQTPRQFGARGEHGWLGVYQRVVAPVHEGAVLKPRT